MNHSVRSHSRVQERFDCGRVVVFGRYALIDRLRARKILAFDVRGRSELLLCVCSLFARLDFLEKADRGQPLSDKIAGRKKHDCTSFRKTRLSFPGERLPSCLRQPCVLLSLPLTDLREPLLELPFLPVQIVQLRLDLVLDDPVRFVLERVRIGDGGADGRDKVGPGVGFGVAQIGQRRRDD